MRTTLICTIALLTACSTTSNKPPYSPKQSLEMMRIADGFRIEPFAAEPDIASPAAMDIDEDGRIWVVEDRAYPLDVSGKIGRVKLLEDTNGDGKPDRTTIFADNLVMPTGIMRWKKGVLVTDAPDLLYLEDTDGDGKADVRRKVLTGFPFTNPQHTVNGPVFGLDNWIYLAHENATTAIIFKDQFGDRGSDIRFVDKPEAVLKQRGRSIRFRPDTFEIEALAASSQFGHAFDDFGHRFVLNNTFHARHEVIDSRYLERNPDLPVVTAVAEISDHGTPSKVFPIVPKTRIEMLTNVGEFTSACGLTFWRGGAYVAEPAHNLVHRDIYSASGATFTAKRDREGVEFLASRDPWFRPVNFYAGPDGALYLLDFYRLVIEHPEWMATETYGSKDLTAGIDRGRIYRITPSGESLPWPKGLKLSAASSAELVKHLANENPWWRRTAQRLLMERHDVSVAPQLAEMAASHASPVARVHALWSLAGLGKLETPMIEKALRDSAAGVRENAIRMAEPRRTAEPKLAGLLIEMAASETDARVRFQLLCTLGSVTTAAAKAARDRILAADLSDRWTQLAALSAGSDEAARLFATAVSKQAPPIFFRQAASVIGVRNRAGEVQGVLAAVAHGSQGEWRAAALEGLATGMRGKHPPIDAAAERQLVALAEQPDGAVRRAALRVLETGKPANGPALKSALERAEAAARDHTKPADLRADSLGLLALSDPPSRRALFEQLSAQTEPEPVQMAAIRALGLIPGDETGKFLLKNWRGYTSPVRMEAADALYRDPGRAAMIVGALKSGELQPWTLAFRHKRQLVMHRDEKIRAAARPILEATEGERAKVVAQYQPALERAADAGKGKEVFDNTCRKCHKLDGVGKEVGPDLATMRNQPKELLLTAILNPSQSISQGFEAYVVETNSGGTIDGVLGEQTATTITLRREEGKQDVIQRKDIKTMYVTNLSAMPADLEKQVSVAQMADLLEYLKAGR